MKQIDGLLSRQKQVRHAVDQYAYKLSSIHNQFMSIAKLELVIDSLATSLYSDLHK